MIFRLFEGLLGYCRFTLRGSSSALATLFLRQKINVIKLKPSGDCVSFECLLYEKKRILKLLKDYPFEVVSCTYGGLPALLWRYRKRVGLMTGALSFALIVWSASLFLWQIEVVGNERLSDTEVLDLLADHGFSVGCYLPAVEVKQLCNDCLLDDGRIAYLAVNIIGTHCEVQVRETKTGAPMQEEPPSDIVATYDGQIQRLEVYSGQALLKAGETVQAGQVVISGLSKLPEETYRLERAEGKVYAKITRDFSVTVPYEEVQKVYTGEVIEKKSLIFFKKKIKLFKNSGISLPSYDTIETSNSITLGEGLILPVGIETIEYRAYVTETIVRSEDEVYRIARARMADLLAHELAEADLLTISRTVSFDEVGCTISCSVYCIADIAKEQPIVGLPDRTEEDSQ